MFSGVKSIGVLKHHCTKNYTKIISALPSTWTNKCYTYDATTHNGGYND